MVEGLTTMAPQRTYWHLQGNRRVPSQYEVCTSRLLYHGARPFAVQTGGAGWLEQFQRGSALQASFADFTDPRRTTYASYVAIQQEREAFVDGLLRSVEETGYDQELEDSWVDTLERVLPVLRYPCHGLQMLAAYVGHMAPEGRIVVSAAFQAADEMRRIHRLSYRMRQLQQARSGFGEAARAAWQTDTAWQPTRAALERLLVRYDFGEALVGLNLVLKPAFDELFMVQFAELATHRGDRLLAELLRSLDDDCRWHRSWTDAAMQCAIRERRENSDVIAGWISNWWGAVRPVLPALVNAWGIPAHSAERRVSRVEQSCQSRWSALGLTRVT